MNGVYKTQIHIPVDSSVEGKVGRQRRDIGIVTVGQNDLEIIVPAKLNIGREIEIEACITALVFANKISVNKERKFLVGAFKIDIHAASLHRFGNIYLTRITCSAPVISRLVIVCVLGIPGVRDVHHGGRLAFAGKVPRVIDCVNNSLLRIQSTEREHHSYSQQYSSHNLTLISLLSYCIVSETLEPSARCSVIFICTCSGIPGYRPFRSAKVSVLAASSHEMLTSEHRPCS